MQRANASLLIGTSSWKEQFVEAITVSASDESDQKKPSGLDYVLHVLTLFWKILFAFVPPTGILFIVVRNLWPDMNSIIRFLKV